MKKAPIQFTSEGIEVLTTELEQLKDKKEEKRQADLNTDVSFYDQRMDELDTLIHEAGALSTPESEDVIETGAFVTLQDMEFNDNVEYRIVNHYEADPLKHYLSEESPIGLELVGKNVGNRITVNGVEGTLTYEILAVEYRNT